jgi:serine/threonine protein kinase
MPPHGILFEEDPGYLLICLLGHGTTGQTMLVRDQRSGSTYVRKRIQNREPLQLTEGKPAEVWALRKPPPHELVPFIKETSESRDGGWTIISQFCNGGNLVEFIDCFEAKKEMVLEGMLWHVYACLAKAIAFLQHGYRESERLPEEWELMFHNDLHPANVFLDHAGSALPLVMLGDFGDATCPPRTDDDELPVQEGPRGDILDIGHIIRILMLASWQPKADYVERHDLALTNEWGKRGARCVF